MTGAVTIRRYLDVAMSPKLRLDIDAIFFEASNTQSFHSDAARDAFRDRWLGRYLRHEPGFAYLAMTLSGEVAGYLVGCVDERASKRYFADIGFAEYEDLMQRFPAHLHVNVAAAFRNRGIGRELIEAFVADAAQSGAPGVHVVTSAHSRNVVFYRRNGFFEFGRMGVSEPIVFLGRVI